MLRTSSPCSGLDVQILLLGVTRHAKFVVIDTPLFRWHPDKNIDNAEEAAEMFRKINRANQVLSDERRKEIYDKHGHHGLQLYEQFGEEGMMFNVCQLCLINNAWLRVFLGMKQILHHA
jgi:hypothetical protein